MQLHDRVHFLGLRTGVAINSLFTYNILNVYVYYHLRPSRQVIKLTQINIVKMVKLVCNKQFHKRVCETYYV